MKTTPSNEPHSTEHNILKHDYDETEGGKPVQAEPLTSILIIDSDLKILSVNSAFESSSDFSIKELKGKYFYLYIAPEIVDIVLDFINQHKNDPSFPTQIQYEIDLFDKNSNLRNIIVNLSMLPDKNLALSLIDITNLRTEENQKSFENKFLNALPNAFSINELLYDEENNPVDFKILKTNKNFESLFQLSQKEITGRLAADLYHFNDFSVLKKIAQVVQYETVARIDYYHQAFDLYLEIYVASWKDMQFSMMFFDVTQKKKKELLTARRIQQQQLLLDISNKFTKVFYRDVDNLINETLAQIGGFESNDRSYIMLFSEDGQFMSNTHEWCRQNISSEIHSLQNISTAPAQWFMSKLCNFESVHIPSVRKLTDEAQTEKEMLTSHQIKSLIVVPIEWENKLIGFMGYDSVRYERTWSAESISNLTIISNIVAYALQRKQYILNLKESTNYYRAIFENTGSATYILHEDMTILDANNEWERTFGYSKEELIGNKWIMMFLEDDLPLHVDYHKKRRKDPSSVPNQINIRILNKEGKIRNCLANIDMIPGTTNSVATILDITELNRTNRALKALNAVNTAMLHAKDEAALLRTVCQSIVDIGGYYFTWVGYVQNDADKTLEPMAYAGHEDGYLDHIKIQLAKQSHDSSVESIVLSTNQPYVCEDISTCKYTTSWQQETIKRQYRSSISIPLCINKNIPEGILTIYTNTTEKFDNEEISLLSETAHDLAYGIRFLRTQIERDNYEKTLEKNLEDVKQLMFQTVSALEAVIRIRDPYTAEHQRKVALLSSAIAEEMNLDSEMKTAIFIAASLHDIGKMNIPIDILNKPGKISDLEFGIIAGHSQTGYEVIKNIHFPWSIDEIILQHHEKMDGSGYPNGLKGNEIHLAARIICVADVVEAMSSHRPYRPALGLDKALEEISLINAQKYDQDVVKACLNVFHNNNFSFT
jgi:PAS domain S-box-containing protein/putative nucleotidyltransferase with HDIG domain